MCHQPINSERVIHTVWRQHVGQWAERRGKPLTWYSDPLPGLLQVPPYDWLVLLSVHPFEWMIQNAFSARNPEPGILSFTCPPPMTSSLLVLCGVNTFTLHPQFNEYWQSQHSRAGLAASEGGNLSRPKHHHAPAALEWQPAGLLWDPNRTIIPGLPSALVTSPVAPRWTEAQLWWSIRYIGFGKGCVCTIIRRCRRPWTERTRCAVSIYWTRGSLAPLTSGSASTDGGVYFNTYMALQ